MWNWARKQPIRDRFVWPKYELDKGIYSYWQLEGKTNPNLSAIDVKQIETK